MISSRKKSNSIGPVASRVAGTHLPAPWIPATTLPGLRQARLSLQRRRRAVRGGLSERDQ